MIKDSSICLYLNSDLYEFYLNSSNNDKNCNFKLFNLEIKHLMELTTREQRDIFKNNYNLDIFLQNTEFIDICLKSNKYTLEYSLDIKTPEGSIINLKLDSSNKKHSQFINGFNKAFEVNLNSLKKREAEVNVKKELLFKNDYKFMDVYKEQAFNNIASLVGCEKHNDIIQNESNIIRVGDKIYDPDDID